MSDKPRSSGESNRVSDVLSDPGTSLGSLFRHTRTLARIDSLLRSRVDPDTAAQFRVANVREDRLILVTPTAAWATRLRMHAPELLQRLQSSGYPQLRHIDLRVAPITPEPAVTKKRRPTSPEAERAFQNFQRLTNKTTR